MKRSFVLWAGPAALVLFAMAGAVWIATLPPVPSPGKAMPPIARQEIDAAIVALKPPKRQRPLVAILGINDATEATDYLMPYGILRRADVADVVMLATRPGTVTLFPALKVEPQATAADFDRQHPEGADYVIVPAMSRDDDPTALEWIRSQAEKGAIIIGVCAGAKVVGNTGLLDGRRATTHWYYLKELRDKHPAIRYVPDRRIVVDRGVATTTGISASMPMSLALIEAIAGRDKAEAVGREIGLPRWDASHDSDAFRFTRSFALTAIFNTIGFWNREQLGIELKPGVDEVSLALVADAWSRTYRSHAITFAPAADLRTRNGIRLVPDRITTDWPAQYRLPAITDQPPAIVLAQVLNAIETRYGRGTADSVAMQLEYAGDRSSAAVPSL